MLSNSELIKKQIDNWVKNKTTNISKIFHKCLENDNKISTTDVQIIMKSKCKHDITHWHLVFGKERHDFYIKKEALQY